MPIKQREQHNIAIDRKVIAAKDRMRVYLAANTDANNLVHIQMEVVFFFLIKKKFFSPYSDTLATKHTTVRHNCHKLTCDGNESHLNISAANDNPVQNITNENEDPSSFNGNSLTDLLNNFNAPSTSNNTLNDSTNVPATTYSFPDRESLDVLLDNILEPQ